MLLCAARDIHLCRSEVAAAAAVALASAEETRKIALSVKAASSHRSLPSAIFLLWIAERRTNERASERAGEVKMR